MANERNKRKGRKGGGAAAPNEGNIGPEDTTQPGVPNPMGNAAPALSDEAEIDEAATTALSETAASARLDHGDEATLPGVLPLVPFLFVVFSIFPLLVLASHLLFLSLVVPLRLRATRSQMRLYRKRQSVHESGAGEIPPRT